MRLPILGFMALSISIAGAPAFATTVTDPAGDFLPSSNVAARTADLDIRSFSVSLHGADFLFSATMNGAIAPTSAGLYVFGINEGSGATPFASIGEGDVAFNVADVVHANGASSLGTFTVSGDTITGSIPVASLTSHGFDPSQYGFSLWTRLPGGVGLSNLADFAPNNATITAVPEPASWALMLLGVGATGAMLRRHRAAGAPVVA